MQELVSVHADRISRWVHYRRQLHLGNFSLEANTESAPEPGHFYVLRGGHVLMCCDDFGSAETMYLGLCRDHWRLHLTSNCPTERMACAWGLLGIEPTDSEAIRVIEEDGRPDDRKRLLQMQNRRRAFTRRAMGPGGAARKRP